MRLLPPRPAAAVLATVLCVLATLVLVAVPATAAPPTGLSLTSRAGFAGADAPLAVRLLADDGTPVAGASVLVERRDDGTWRRVAVVVTDEQGLASTSATRRRDPARNVFRATYAGDDTHDAATARTTSAIRPRAGAVTLTGPAKVVDERSVRLRVVSRTVAGEAVPGVVRIERAVTGEPWRSVRSVRTDPRGVATFTVTPRVDSRWRARTTAQPWVTGDLSHVLGIDNLPPGEPVVLPPGAPRPRVQLPPQPRATARGAHPVITPIPDGVWADMTGRSWHSGCPVGRSGLRLLRINYWGYDGYRYRGEVVGATGAIDNFARALGRMYAARYPIRSMYRVDRFGWSERVRGADDHRSMAAGNTSGFNCRWVVNRPGVLSPHATGRSLDVNTWENPYHSATGWVPNTWWASRSHARVAWRSRDHGVVKIFLRSGFSWTYGSGDSQHFDAHASSGRTIAPSPRACGGFVCH